MTPKLVFRAATIEGVVHGGGGVSYSKWRNSYDEAMADLKNQHAVYSDSVMLVEARMSPHRAPKTPCQHSWLHPGNSPVQLYCVKCGILRVDYDKMLKHK